MNLLKTITRLELEILYRIAMKRITKKFSTEQLSFLIGKPDDYVKNIEMLQTKFYTPEDLKCISIAFDDYDVDSYHPASMDETELEVRMEKQLINQQLFYKCTVHSADNENYEYFSLMDVSPVVTEDDLKTESVLAKDALKLLIDAGNFFEARFAVDFYLSLNDFLGRTLNPDALKKALKELVHQPVHGQEKSGALFQLVEIAQNRFAYQHI
jgi:hypothetical protein